MNFFELKTKYPEKSLKIFNIKLYEWKYVKREDAYYRTIFGGLLSTYLKNSYAECTAEKDFKLCGIPLFKRIDDGETRALYLFNKILLYKIPMPELIKYQQRKLFSGKYDGVFVISCNSGEAYLFLRHIFQAFIEKYKIKNPLIICTKKYHSYLVQTYCPNVPHFINGFPRYPYKHNFYDIGGVKFYIVMHPLYFTNFDKSILEGKDVHYFNAILNDAKISKEDIAYNPPVILQKDKDSALNKINKTGLNLNNFVFISPESLSCRNNDSVFWCDIIKYYQNKGFDIFVNIVQNKLDLSSVEFKSCFLTFPEALEIAKMSKKIIGLRSGLLEYLLQAEVDIDVIYAPFHDAGDEIYLTTKQVKGAYSMKKLPFIKSKVTEYNKEEYLEIIKG